MKLLPLFQELVFALFMGRVRLAGINRADLCTLRSRVSTNALGALGRVNFIGGVALANCVVGAFRLTGTAAYAIIGDFV
jgi:hypothetical protein